MPKDVKPSVGYHVCLGSVPLLNASALRVEKERERLRESGRERERGKRSGIKRGERAREREREKE